MDWFAVYGKLIEKRQTEKLVYVKGKTPGIERHHIVPKSMDGTDDEKNIVNLTAREHFIAHLLLHRMYPRNIYMLNAVYQMSRSINLCRNTVRTYRVPAREIMRFRQKFRDFLRNSKWINDGNGRRHRIWKDDPVPDGWSPGMGAPSEKFRRSMNERQKRMFPVIVDGTVYSPADAERKFGVPRSQIAWRIKKGWTPEDAVKTPYTKVDRSFKREDQLELESLFEERKTRSTAELINLHPDIFGGRHGKITAERLVTLFKHRIPDYEKRAAEINGFRQCMKPIPVEWKGRIEDFRELASMRKIDLEAVKRRLGQGWTLEDALGKPVMKTGENFVDTPEKLREKRDLAERMYKVFVENGYGSTGLDAVNREFGTGLKYDGLRRRFRKFGLDPRKPAMTYE